MPVVGATSNLTVDNALVAPGTSRLWNAAVAGHLVSAGPSVYSTGTSTSKMPASGAISTIGPNCLAAVAALSPTSIVPTSAF